MRVSVLQVIWQGVLLINEFEYFKYGHNEIDRILIEGGLLGIVLFQ